MTFVVTAAQPKHYHRPMILALRMAALGAVVAAAIHATALTVPAFAAATYPPGYPVWRHGVFIAVNLSAAWLFLRRPWWFAWAYAVLTAQVLYSHGGSAWSSWQRAGHVALIDVAALIAIPLALGLLVMDYRRRERAQRVSHAIGASRRSGERERV